jgi:Chaperone of endosialidase
MGLGIMKMLFGLSDRRDKTDIEKLGKSEETGLPIYAYRYKGDPKNTPKVVGPMAQDIEKKYPEAVKEVGGHKIVTVPGLLAA